jgi:outer membrane receptor for ferrienterochelin and colicins
VRKSFCFISVVWFVLQALLAIGQSYGQGRQYWQTVLDGKTNEPVPFANVLVEGIKTQNKTYYVTSTEGKFNATITQPSLVIISCVGYETLHDSIQPGGEVKFLLKPSVLNMQEVVVTGQYSPERVDKSIYHVKVINARQIEMKAATNMTELLNKETNMRVTQSGVLGTNLSMQGLSGENVKFMVDGVPMIGRMQGNIDLNQISLYNVDHLEIIEGPMSVIYGSNAIAGVVNIITKENKSTRYTMYGNGYLESVGQYNFDGGISANLKKHTVSLDGGRDFFGGYSIPSVDTGRAQSFKPRRQYFVNGYYVFTNNAIRFKLSGQYFNELLVDKGNLFPPYFETAFDSYFTTIRYTGKAEYSMKLPNDHFLNIIAAYSYYDRIKKKYFKDLTTLEEVITPNPDDQDTTGVTSWMGRATFAKNNSGKFNYQTGIDINIESGTGKRILNNYQQIGDFAGFASIKWDPWKFLSFQPGIRLIYNTKFTAPVVFALSGKWTIREGFNLRLAYSKGFRSPAIKELYMYFVDINHNIQANPELRSETSNNINLNLNYSIERKKRVWSMELAGFYNHVNNIITLGFIDSKTSLYKYINVDKYNAISGQLNLSYSLYPALTLQGGVAEIGRNYHNNQLSKSTDFSFSTDFSADFSYRFDKADLTFALNYKYTGQTPMFLITADTISQGVVKSYSLMDFTATKGFLNSMVRLSAGVKNIFDVTTTPAVGTGNGGGGAHGSGGSDGPQAIAWGRTFFISLSLNINKLK